MCERERESVYVCVCVCMYVSMYICIMYVCTIPVGATFSPPVQTGPGAHPASCIIGTGSFPGVEVVGEWG